MSEQKPLPWADEGISLRDYFAGQALTGLLSALRSYINDAEIIAQAYSIADGMILARGAKGGAP